MKAISEITLTLDFEDAQALSKFLGAMGHSDSIGAGLSEDEAVRIANIHSLLYIVLGN